MKWAAAALSLLLLAETVDAVAVPPAPWWSGISVAGILAILAAVTVSITTIITAWHTGQTKKAVEAVAAVNVAQTSKLTEIKTLVDGGKSELLGELAEIKRAVANRPGSTAAEEVAAVSAQRKYDDQQARVDEASAQADAKRNRRAEDEPMKP